MIEKLRECVAWLRHEASGKTFSSHPELFKDIESLKAKIGRLEDKYTPEYYDQIWKARKERSRRRAA